MNMAYQYILLLLTDQRADCKKAINLIKNIDTKSVFVDHAYDTDEILSYLNKQNIKQDISPKCNRICQHNYD